MAKPGVWVGNGKPGQPQKAPAAPKPAAPPPAAPPPAAAPATFTPLPISKQGVQQARQDATYTAVAKELGIRNLDNKRELTRVQAVLSARANGPGHTDSRPIPTSPVFLPQGGPTGPKPSTVGQDPRGQAPVTQAPAAFTPLPISRQGVRQARQDATYIAVAKELGIKKLDSKKELTRVQAELSARKTAADQAAAATAPVFTPQRTNALTPYLNTETGGFGLNFYNQAKAAGMSASQIATLIPGSGAVAVGEGAQQALQRDIEDEKYGKLREYETKFEDERRDYQEKFESSMQQYRAGLQESQTRSTQLAGELSSAQAAREEARTRADAIEKQRREEQEASVSQQLSGLRSGSTVGGTPGAGLGSLTSGGSALSGRRSLGRGGAEQDGVLASYRRSIDPTDSVLDKDMVVDSMTRGGGGGSRRSEAGRRALASGGGSSYYASRFG